MMLFQASSLHIVVQGTMRFGLVCWSLRLFVTVTDISGLCQPDKLKTPARPDRDSIPVSQDTMTNNHQRVDQTTPRTAQPSGLAGTMR